MPSNSSTRLDEAMASEIENLRYFYISFSTLLVFIYYLYVFLRVIDLLFDEYDLFFFPSVSVIESMKSVSDLLSEMLQEVDPNDRAVRCIFFVTIFFTGV